MASVSSTTSTTSSTMHIINGRPLSCDENNYSMVYPGVDYEFLEKDYCCAMKPINMRFICTRKVDFIDSSIKELYQIIVAQKAHLRLTEKPSICHTNAVMGHCGNSRGALTECACESLNRLTSPELRNRYENEVIDAAARICAKTPKGQPIQLNIAVFASGGLHGEEVLLIRLIDCLKNLKFKGTINLFLLDLQYRDNIGKAGSFTLKNKIDPPRENFSWDHFIGDREDLSQFVTEISLCLPPTIEVYGFVFSDANDYIKRAQAKYEFRHDLLIGADIENEMALFNHIKKQTFRIPNEPGLVLIKDSNLLPRMCTVPSSSSQEIDCSLIRRIGPVARAALPPAAASSATATRDIDGKGIRRA